MMKLCLLIVLPLILSEVTVAQEALQSTPLEEHKWLQKFDGTWTSESKGTMGPDQPEIQCSGTMTCRVLGNFWIMNEWTNEMQGASLIGIQTIGYDPNKKKYVGTWVDNMMNHMWQYEGVVVDRKKLILEAKGPNFTAPGKEAMFRDSYEFLSDNEIRVTSEMQGEDGKWITFMTGTAKRQANQKN